MSDRFNKSFSFSIDLPLFKKAVEVLELLSPRAAILWRDMFLQRAVQFVSFKPRSYYLEETIGFDVKASFASHPVSRLIR